MSMCYMYFLYSPMHILHYNVIILLFKNAVPSEL